MTPTTQDVTSISDLKGLEIETFKIEELSDLGAFAAQDEMVNMSLDFSMCSSTTTSTTSSCCG